LHFIALFPPSFFFVFYKLALELHAPTLFTYITYSGTEKF